MGYANESAVTRLLTKLKTLLTGKQDTLVSGTNIKTINNASLLGSGNINVNEIFYAISNQTSHSDLFQAITDGKTIIIDYNAVALAWNDRFIEDEIHLLSISPKVVHEHIIDSNDNWTTTSKRFVFQEGLKTINNQSLIGSGNIDIQGGGSGVTVLTYGVSTNYEVGRACSDLSTTPVFVSWSDIIYTVSQIVLDGEDEYIIDASDNLGIKYSFTVTSNDEWSYLSDSYAVPKSYVDNAMDDKQDKLVSGTNIKTINNTSLLGSGNIDIQGGGSDVFVATWNVTPVQDVIDAWEAKKVVLLYIQGQNTFIASHIRGHEDGYGHGGVWTYSFDREGTPDYSFFGFDYDSSTDTYSWDPDVYEYDYLVRDSQLAGYASKTYVDTAIATEATDTVAGTIKLNPNQNITLNANGQLEVGGRIGQFEGTTGLFAPNNRAPRNVLDYSFLMTDALGVDMSANRSMAVVSGYGLTCKSAAAGSTQYRISNTYANRIIAKLCEGGYASRDEATSKVEQIIPVVSVRIGGSSYTPNSSANDSSTAGDIVITTAETLNPSGAITNIRLFGKMQSYASLHLGNGIRSEAGGRSVVLGGAVTKVGSTNDNCLIGNAIYSSGNGNAAFGRNHICIKNRGFFAGTGHDSTNARTEGASAVGEYSYMDSNTMFAVGNGTSHTARSNAFEVTSDGGIVLKSPGGTRYKITVDNNGNLTSTLIS